MPKISVVIPCYNARNTISKTLHSIAMQSIAEDVEIIIANDADGLPYHDIISKFPELNIKFVVNEVNKGCSGARNLGIRNASADFVFFLDADDQLVSSISLEILYESIKAKNVDMLGSVFESEVRTDKGVVIRKMEHQPTWCHGRIYRRQYLLDNNLFFNEKLRLNEDMEFHQLLFDMGAKVAEIPMVTVLWRDNPKSLTHESLYKNKRTFVDACAEYIKDCNERGLMNERVVRRVLQNLVMIYFYYNVCLDECEDKADEFMSACREYWKLAEPIVADVPDELVTKVYCGIAKTFEFIPSVGFIKFLNELRAG